MDGLFTHNVSKPFMKRLKTFNTLNNNLIKNMHTIKMLLN